MIRRSFVLGAAATTLALSGCGGSGSSTPTPTPTPTSTASPTPTPVTYGTFPLTASTEFGTINAFTVYTGDLTAGPITFGSTGTEIGTTRFRAAYLADPTAASAAAPQVVRENTEEARYVAAELVVPPATTVDEYAFNTTTITKNGTSTTVTGARAEFLNNTVTGKVTATPALALTKVTYSGWIRDDSATGQHRVTYGVSGFPTVLSDLPTTGTATYTTTFAGKLISANGAGIGTRTSVTTTATVTVNFATGVVSISMPVASLGGTFTGTGAYPIGSTQFSGSFDGSSPTSGTFTGTVFGSAGAELGMTVAVSGTVGGNTVRLVGAIVGKKN